MVSISQGKTDYPEELSSNKIEEHKIFMAEQEMDDDNLK